MAQTLTAPRAGIPIAGNQPPTNDYLRYFQALTARVGGVSGTPTAVIEGVANQALAVAQAVEQRATLAGDGITVMLGSGGYTVSVNLAHVINAVRAFMPRPPDAAPAVNDSQRILAARIFGA